MCKKLVHMCKKLVKGIFTPTTSWENKTCIENKLQDTKQDCCKEMGHYLRDSSGLLKKPFHPILREYHVHGRPTGKGEGESRWVSFTNSEIRYTTFDWTVPGNL